MTKTSQYFSTRHSYNYSFLRFRSLVVLFTIFINNVSSFSPFYSRYHMTQQPSSSPSPTVLQCICINCAKVTDCKAYNFVENKHLQPNINPNPTFTPRDGSPTIHVNIRTNRNNMENEIGRLWSEHVEETRKAKEKASSTNNNVNVNANSSNTDSNSDSSNESSGNQMDEKLVGEESYDFSVKTTYEYDVVACEDFEKDNGCWVRNIPEEIRLANPDFVPT
mmetsp:Transcript_19634/g.24213  ORF Transcript_19634/g.24213 Transcript_19634/m.24213 type:complete len:221 (+) Transcript_19634:84-746(+)